MAYHNKKQLRDQKRNTNKTKNMVLPKKPKQSTAIKKAVKTNSYNDKVRAYAKKHKCTITQATIALME